MSLPFICSFSLSFSLSLSLYISFSLPYLCVCISLSLFPISVCVYLSFSLPYLCVCISLSLSVSDCFWLSLSKLTITFSPQSLYISQFFYLLSVSLFLCLCLSLSVFVSLPLFLSLNYCISLSFSKLAITFSASSPFFLSSCSFNHYLLAISFYKQCASFITYFATRYLSHLYIFVFLIYF